MYVSFPSEYIKNEVEREKRKIIPHHFKSAKKIHIKIKFPCVVFCLSVCLYAYLYVWTCLYKT